MSDITRVLQDMERGEPGAADHLMSLVYEELRLLAAQKMACEALDNTLQPTALVHEAWIRLGADQQPSWNSRSHFFGAAAEAMRRILISRARSRQTLRRGSGQKALNADDFEFAIHYTDDERLLAVNEALDKLQAEDPRKADLVKLRYFVGMTIDEAARTLGISEPTAKRWWFFARAWLFSEIRSQRA